MTASKANAFQDIDTPKRGKKVLRTIIIILVIMGLIGGAVAVLVFNVFNLRDDYLYEPLSGLPLVGQWMPTPYGFEAEPLPTIEELGAEIEAYRATIASLQAETERLDALNLSQSLEINRLAEFEAGQAGFNQARADFDRMVAEGDPRAYAAFFAQINPEMQAQLYAEIRGNLVIDDQTQGVISLYENMNVRAATDALEAMIGTNTPLVLTILEGVSLNTRTSIVQSMSNSNRVLITNLLAP